MMPLMAGLVVLVVCFTEINTKPTNPSILHNSKLHGDPVLSTTGGNEERISTLIAKDEETLAERHKRSVDNTDRFMIEGRSIFFVDDSNEVSSSEGESNCLRAVEVSTNNITLRNHPCTGNLSIGFPAEQIFYLSRHPGHSTGYVIKSSIRVPSTPNKRAGLTVKTLNGANHLQFTYEEETLSSFFFQKLEGTDSHIIFTQINATRLYLKLDGDDVRLRDTSPSMFMVASLGENNLQMNI